MQGETVRSWPCMKVTITSGELSNLLLVPTITGKGSEMSDKMMTPLNSRQSLSVVGRSVDNLPSLAIVPDVKVLFYAESLRNLRYFLVSHILSALRCNVLDQSLTLQFPGRSPCLATWSLPSTSGSLPSTQSAIATLTSPKRTGDLTTADLWWNQ
jgi:hypothetical protein